MLTCEIISPRAVLTWYKYRYFRCRASSRVSRGLEFDRERWARCRRLAGLRWSNRQAVMKSCTIILTMAATGHVHSSTPPQHGGGAGLAFILVNYGRIYNIKSAQLNIAFSQIYHNITQITVLRPCIKKSMDDTIMAEPTILDDTIVINLAHSKVSTANIIAPPPIATSTSRSCI